MSAGCQVDQCSGVRAEGEGLEELMQDDARPNVGSWGCHAASMRCLQAVRIGTLAGASR